MSKREKKETKEVVEILKVQQEAVTFHILGVSPFVCNAMGAHGREEMTIPSQKKSGKEREASLKHDLLAEYQRSCYRSAGDDAPTRITFPAAGFKRGMASAALELPGVNKAQIGRLCWAEGHTVSIYGVPQMWSTIVRMANQNRTPDMRTRAIIPEWATTVTMSYVTPNLRAQPVINLMASAGVFIGIGDGRPEKGALSYGRFEVVAEDDERYQRIIKSGGRGPQDAALENPTFFDVDTEELYAWFCAEVKRRGFKVA